MDSVNCATYWLSACSRASEAFSRASWRFPSSLRHSSCARSRAPDSTSRPWRSYLFRERLNLTTTADKVEYFRLRLVSAVSPRGRNTRWSRSAHSRQSGFPFSILRKLPFHNSSPHSAQAEGFKIEKTTISPFTSVAVLVSTAMNFYLRLLDCKTKDPPRVDW